MNRRPAADRTITVLEPVRPRVLSKDAAAAYCGCETLAAFEDWIRRGIIPGPIAGTTRWDIKAIDAALDRRAGLAPTITPETPEVSPYEAWKRQNAGAT